MAPASDNNNQDLATKKAKLEPGTVLAGGIGKFQLYPLLSVSAYPLYLSLFPSPAYLCINLAFPFVLD